MRDVTYRVLESDEDFISAAIARIRVYVAFVPEDDPTYIIDYGGPVEKVTPNSVKIAGIYYPRSESHEFRIHLPKRKDRLS